MDCELDDTHAPLYRVWLHSPSVFGTKTETILAYKIALEVKGIPSRVLKALRAQPGVDPVLLGRVEAFVKSDPTLRFVVDRPIRSIEVVEGTG
jgi:hypothetical protein